MTVQFALIGAGRIGAVHARAIAANEGARLAAVADAHDVAAKALARRYGCAVRRIGEIVTAGEIDAVVICTPTDTHADLIETFIRAGKAVFCEKPIDLDVGRARACVEMVERAKGVLMLGFNRRFDPHFAALHAAIGRGDIGDVESVQIISRDPAPPPADYIRSSGGIFKDMTIHDFDMARFLLGEEPVQVFASASVLTDAAIGTLGDYDTVSIVLATASGQQCTIVNSRRAGYGYDQRIEVHGSRGMIRAGNPPSLCVETATAAGFVRPPLHDFFMTRYEQAYAAEIMAFITALTDGAAVFPDGRDGLQALLLAEAAAASAREGRAVPLPLTEKG